MKYAMPTLVAVAIVFSALASGFSESCRAGEGEARSFAPREARATGFLGRFRRDRRDEAPHATEEGSTSAAAILLPAGSALLQAIRAELETPRRKGSDVKVDAEAGTVAYSRLDATPAGYRLRTAKFDVNQPNLADFLIEGEPQSILIDRVYGWALDRLEAEGGMSDTWEAKTSRFLPLEDDGALRLVYVQFGSGTASDGNYLTLKSDSSGISLQRAFISGARIRELDARFRPGRFMATDR